MLTENELADAFEVYWLEIAACRKHKAYWALLHIVVCLPDICAALRAPKAHVAKRYKEWCRQWLSTKILAPNERYQIRNKILHQGRSTIDEPGRYERFEFWQPSFQTPEHGKQEGRTVHLNVEELAREMQEGVQNWIRAVATKEAENELVAENLDTLVRVQKPRGVADPTCLVPPPNLSTASGG